MRLLRHLLRWGGGSGSEDSIAVRIREVGEEDLVEEYTKEVDSLVVDELVTLVDRMEQASRHGGLAMLPSDDEGASDMIGQLGERGMFLDYAEVMRHRETYAAARKRTRTIGESLHDQGGTYLMEAVARQVDRRDPGAGGTISLIWSGIGEWRG